ncbi:S8 family serine peptidase [Solwaraspora sp. WMMD1047]|uniref:S8 family peptidase n=1 Tax=Solwaraspora sp. WMMD1047 TaxID=3016102 RepID=UPI002416BCA4|nr:S8 family serine peptidase [Solwaraspora sp. WMMD1047]MDG4834654.1 S8 family serine peptidase [Solwaraspora sp. WMMD1047]
MRRSHRAAVAVSAICGLLAVAATPAAAAEPAGVIRSAGGPTAIAGSYLVVFETSAVAASEVGAAVGDLVHRYGGTVARTYRAALRGAELRAPARVAARIAADPSVAFVEQNHAVTLAGIQPNPPSWGLDRIDQGNLPLDSSYTYPDPATDVHAYVIDTGVRVSHSDFGGRAVSGFDAVDGGPADDCNGHGTHVAGTIGGSAHGVAKAVRIVGVRVLNCGGSGTTAGVVAGVDWVTANAVRPAVANMSLGGAATLSLDTAVRNSINSGISYGLAAGNDFGANACGNSPGRVAEGITVGATTLNDSRSSFSNIGSCLDLFAPGSGITSAWHTGDGASNTISGTSMAAPHVAGAAALLLAANPSWSPQQVRDRLVETATTGVVTSPGAGSPNRLLRVTLPDGPPPADDFSVALTPAAGSTAPGGSVTTTVRTATTSGSAQPVRLTLSGLPAGATGVFEPPTVTSGESATLTISTAVGTPAGRYPVTVTGTGRLVTRTASYVLTVTGTGGTCTASNGTDHRIPDAGPPVHSPVTITGCGRVAAARATVAVRILHSYRGDLVVDLIAPDGSAYRLKSASYLDSADNVDATFAVDLSAEPADGTWRLRVRDVFAYDTGHLDGWTLTV